MSNAFYAAADALDRLADNLERRMNDALGLFGAAMVEYLEANSPRDTGTFAEGWHLVKEGLDWVVTSPAEYGSFIHAKGDESRTPVYIELVKAAVAYAAEQVDMNAVLVDITAEYIGKGWKLLPHNALWLEMTGRVEQGWADSRPVVPTVNVEAGQAGTIRASQVKRAPKEVGRHV